MDKKMRDRDIVKEAIGDPAFYNDKIDAKKEPLKADYNKDEKTKGKKSF